MEAGLVDLVVLVVNSVGDEAGIAEMGGYPLPILQDTEEADVFGLYDAASYDAFVVDREGYVGYVASGVHPEDDGSALLEVLASFQ